MERFALEVIRFDGEDVIATSGGIPTFTCTGLYDGVKDNAVLSFSNGASFQFNGNNDDLLSALRTNMDWDSEQKYSSGTMAYDSDPSHILNLSTVTLQESLGKDKPDKYISMNNIPYHWKEGSWFVQ